MYELSDLINGRLSWIYHDNRKAIWYDEQSKSWAMGSLSLIGGNVNIMGTFSSGDYSNIDLFNVPNDGWQYFNKDEKSLKQASIDDIQIQCNNGEWFLYDFKSKSFDVIIIQSLFTVAVVISESYFSKKG